MASRWSSYIDPVQQEIRATLASPHARLSPLYGMMRYHMGYADASFAAIPDAGGKLLRPLFCLLACEAAGGDRSAAIPASVALELVHNFSLAHDDIEDNSEARRHRTTLWKLWGVPHGINVGDAMFSLARLALARLADRGIPPSRVARAYCALDTACVALCEGQYLDMAFESEPEVGLDDYLWMIRGKTAALLACACELGAIAGTEDASVIRALHQFGYNIGMAFQIEDDRLGVWGDPADTGKPVGDDLVNRKKVLPVVWLWEAMRNGDPSGPQRRAADALARIYAEGSASPADVSAAMGTLRDAGALDYCNELADQYTRIACESLDVPGLHPAAVDALRGLASSLIHRAT